MESFEICEIAIVVTTDYGVRDCEIITALYDYLGEMGHDILVNGVKCDRYSSVNGEWFAPIGVLRKKKPPKEELSTWEEIQKITDWTPSKQKVEL